MLGLTPTQIPGACARKEGKPRLPGAVSVWPGQLHVQGCQCHNKVCAVWLLRKGFQSREEFSKRKQGRKAGPSQGASEASTC